MIVSAMGSESTPNLEKKKRSNEHREDEYEQIEGGTPGNRYRKNRMIS
jgi:hypothetical protein